MWYSLDTTQDVKTGTITATISTPDDSPWFDGHFPGDPTLPGVGQLAMVADALGCLPGKKCVVSGVRRVKFRRRVKPGEILTITATQQKNNSYSFRMTTGKDELVSSGSMTIAPSSMADQNLQAITNNEREE
jgi:3-hydroxymyristoyl/3-hydroxydecanoyl-(acyl carrier protein) dehydratase